MLDSKFAANVRSVAHGSPVARWRARVGLSQRAAAEQLRIALSTLQDHERGTHRVTGEPIETPRLLLLACAALEYGVGAIE